MTFQPHQTVYLPDGREAIYVTQYNGTHLVRVVFHSPGGYDEPPYDYPSDTVMGVQTVYAAPPVEVYDERIKARHATLLELDQQLQAKRQEIADAAKNKTAMEKAAAKYPCIQQDLDFIEGRITHVVKWSGYGAATIHTMPEAFEQIDTWHGRRTHEGMKLLSLFGTDERGRSVGWGLHQYRDGSGSGTTTIWPAKSEAEARAKIEELLSEAFTAWRSGDEKWWHGHIGVAETLKANPWLTAPDDWLKHQAEQAAARKAEKIAKLRAEIEKLEGEE
jgi:hypothetical protein